MPQNSSGPYHPIVHDETFDADPELLPLAALLPRAGAALTRQLHRAVAAHGLTPTSVGVLGVLARRDGLSHRELAAHLGLSPGTLTPVVDVLEAVGAVGRHRDPEDRRVVRLAITPAGRERLDTVQVARTIRDLLPQPTAEDAEIIRGYLLAVLAEAERER